MPTHHEQAPCYDEKKVISAFYIHGTGIVSEYVHMYKCVHLFINTQLNACFKHRLLGQNHDSESVEFRSSSLTTRHRLSKLISALAARSVGLCVFSFIHVHTIFVCYHPSAILATAFTRKYAFGLQVASPHIVQYSRVSDISVQRYK